MFADSLCVSEIGAGDVQHDLVGAEEAPDVKERRAPGVDTPEDVQRPVAPAADKRKQGNPVAADPDADRVVDNARDRVDDVCVEECAARRDKCVGGCEEGFVVGDRREALCEGEFRAVDCDVWHRVELCAQQPPLLHDVCVHGGGTSAVDSTNRKEQSIMDFSANDRPFAM